MIDLFESTETTIQSNLCKIYLCDTFRFFQLDYYYLICLNQQKLAYICIFAKFILVTLSDLFATSLLLSH